MAATHDRPAFDIGHPAPDRDRVGFGALMLCLLAAPALWSLQHLVLYGFASHYCGLEPAVAARADAAWLEWLLPAVNLAALVGAALALALSIRNLRRTRHEFGSGGVMDAGTLILNPIIQEVKRRAFQPCFEATEIVAAKLGLDGAPIGAAMLARDAHTV